MLPNPELVSPVLYVKTGISKRRQCPDLRGCEDPTDSFSH